MHSVLELNVIKSKPTTYQRAVIDELTYSFAKSSDSIPSDVLNDDLSRLSDEENKRALRYCLLAIIAADIATVPYPEGRHRHMESLIQLAKTYHLSENKIIYLTRYADELIRHLQTIEKQQ